MTQQFAGRTALVTGGGSGIGRATALALAAEGALVTVAGRTRDTLEETVRLVEANGGEARSVVADVADEPMKPLLAAHPIGRIAQAAEIADAVVWLSSERAGFITGVALPIDGGYTVP